MVVALQAPPLRPYQRDAVSAVEEAWRSGVRATMLVHAPGSGKTSTGSELARRAVAEGGRVLVLAHRRELVDQFAARLRLFGMRVGIERGAQRAGNASVVVASTQTMARRLAQWARDTFALVLHDECHHAPALSARTILDYFAPARVCGLTASPDRADQVALRTVFETCAHRFDVLEAVQQGFLVPARGIRVEVPGMDLSKVRRRSRPTSALAGDAPEDQATFSDLHPGDLGKVMIAPACVEGVVGPLLELTKKDDGYMRTVVFAVDRAHASAIAASLNVRVPDCAYTVDGSMHPRDRAAVLADFTSGVFPFLVNVMICTEGLDIPAIECVALARPTQSRILVAQTCGRALRPHPSKTCATIIDFTTNTSRFNLIGPEDVLGGIMMTPAPGDNRPRKPPAEIAAYAGRSRAVRFMLRAVELMRRAAAGAGRGVVGVGRAVQRGPGRVRFTIARAWSWLVGG